MTVKFTFPFHAAMLGNSLRRQAGALQKLAYACWKYDRQTLRDSYIATGRSNVEYGASNWLSCMFISMLKKREIKTLRETSQYRSSLYYFYRSNRCKCEPPLYENTGRIAEYDCHREVTEDNSNESETYNSDSLDMATHSKA